MRLKSLKLAGFKSFAKPTTFTFRHGITAIVGPNGCGKSNVIDAIRWVLGESSAKQLRGGAMSDVIFAGTQNAAAKSVASVELTLEHTQDEVMGIRHEMNLYHELSIRRQVSLEGRSDYFINGTRCRRRDVIDVFLGTGLSSRSYAVIQQGMIGRIVDSSPMQLREFIEEAAGVSRYQARREETQKKLESTKDNLARLDDIRSELLRRQKLLDKQAASAQAYQALKAELIDIQQKLAIAQLTEAKLQELAAKADQKKLSAQVEDASAKITTLKAKLGQLESKIAESQWLKDTAQERYHQSEMTRQQASHQLESLTDKLQQSVQRIDSITAKIHDSDAESASLNQQLTEQSARLETLTPKAAELEQNLAKYQQQQAPLEHAWQELQSQLNELQAHIRSLEQQQALDKQAQSQLDQQQDKWQRQDSKWQHQKSEWLAADESESEGGLAAQIDHIHALLETLDRQQADVQERLATLQPTLDQLSQTLADKRHEQQALQKHHAALTGEYDSLHRIVHPQPPNKRYHNKAILQANDSTSDAHLELLTQLPKLSEQIELSTTGQAHAQALDYWLTFWLNSIVTSESISALQALYSAEPRPKSDLKLASGSKVESESNMPDRLDSVLFTIDSAKTSSNLATQIKDAIALDKLIAKPRLAIWQHCYLYLGAKQEMATLTATLNQLPKGALLLTPTGWLISHTVSLHLTKLTGKDQSASNAQFLTQRLQQSKRLAELESALSMVEDQLDNSQQDIKALQAQHDELAVTLQELTAQAATLTHTEHEKQRQLTTLTAQFEHQQLKQSRLQADREVLDSEQQELSQAQSQLDAKVAQTTKDLAILRPKLTDLDHQRAQLATERERYQHSQQADKEALQNLRFEIKKAELAVSHTSDQLSKITIRRNELQNARQAAERKLDQAQAKLPQLEQAKATAEHDCHQQQVALDEHKANLSALKSEQDNQQQQLQLRQSERQDQQSQLAEVNTQVAVAAERIKEASDRLEASGFAVSASTILTEIITYGAKHTDDPEVLQQREADLTTQLSAMGAVNLAAAEELEDINSRLHPLEQQIDDIKASMTTLTAAIDTIDTKTKALFMQTLAAVNQDLGGLFAKVFGGGQAQLSLQKDESLTKADQWRAGLELMAQPKGKKNSRLAVLSGGEKTLTALSLVFAIFKQHPAPFCVLDEVDAPLDDANVNRFTGLIHELADDVQFIFISHNKLAMQIADELKGITMPQAGISTLVSVSLEEAERYIEA